MILKIKARDIYGPIVDKVEENKVFERNSKIPDDMLSQGCYSSLYISVYLFVSLQNFFL